MLTYNQEEHVKVFLTLLFHLFIIISYIIIHLNYLYTPTTKLIPPCVILDVRKQCRTSIKDCIILLDGKWAIITINTNMFILWLRNFFSRYIFYRYTSKQARTMCRHENSVHWFLYLRNQKYIYLSIGD